ncbi:hypothetical protein BH11MYX3_BH11MYX3_00340 [soil metagenome]
MIGRTAQGALLVLFATTAAGAEGFSIKLEPGVAVPLSEPQSDIYDVGGGQSLKALFGVSPYLDVGPTASFLFLPAATDEAESGVVWGLGAGVRVKRPHNRLTSGTSPWFEADLLYIRTGGLNRPGFDLAAGVAFPLDEAKSFWAGPFVRYQQTVSGERMGYDTRDAKIILAGLSIEFGTGLKRRATSAPPPMEPAREPEPPQPIVQIQKVESCPDRDADTVPDNIDRCPDVAGVIESAGCAAPTYATVVVTKDKIELKEKLFFAWNRAEIKPESFRVLDDVALAMKDNPTIRVRIEGHTDSSGAAEHNQKLSQRRAESVLSYLVTHGITSARLVAQGFGPAVPLDTNDTSDGREKNRRVEFVVLAVTASTESPQ